MQRSVGIKQFTKANTDHDSDDSDEDNEDDPHWNHYYRDWSRVDYFIELRPFGPIPAFLKAQNRRRICEYLDSLDLTSLKLNTTENCFLGMSFLNFVVSNEIKPVTFLQNLRQLDLSQIDQPKTAEWLEFLVIALECHCNVQIPLPQANQRNETFSLLVLMHVCNKTPRDQVAQMISEFDFRNNFTVHSMLSQYIESKSFKGISQICKVLHMWARRSVTDPKGDNTPHKQLMRFMRQATVPQD